MDKAYLQQFSNRNIIPALLQSENILTLEEVLSRTGEQMISLDFSKGKMGAVPEQKELGSLLEEAKAETDNFLGVSDIDKPTISYNTLFSREKRPLWACLGFGAASVPGTIFLGDNFYLELLNCILAGGIVGASLLTLLKINRGTHYFSKKYLSGGHISLEKESQSLILPAIAHEYTHYVQDEKSIPNLPQYKCLCEGQARSAQRHLSLKKQMEGDNPAYYICNSAFFDLPELGEVYLWLSGGAKANALPGFHAIGNAFFSILEAREGTDIHKEILAGRYCLSSF